MARALQLINLQIFTLSYLIICILIFFNQYLIQIFLSSKSMQQEGQTKRVESYYFHEEYFPKTTRQNCRLYKTADSNADRHFCVSNHNRIEIYALKNPGTNTPNITYKKSVQFFCNIRVLEVIPSQHHSSDYIFIGDENGRFAIWRQQEGFVEHSDTPNYLSPLQKNLLSPYPWQQQTKSFSGISYNFNVKDTQGYLTFTYGQTLVTINFSVKRSGFILHKINRIDISFKVFRKMKAFTLPKNRHLVGFIEQKEEMRTLHILSTKNPQQIEWSISKVNLVDFLSSGNQIVFACFNQVSIYKYNSNYPICTFKVKQGMYSQICTVGNQKYAHIGEQLCVFSKNSFQKYGYLKTTENQSNRQSFLKQAFCIHSNKQEFTLFLRRQNFSTSFIEINPKSSRIIKEITPLSPIFSLKVNQKSGDILAFTASNDQENIISLVEKKMPVNLKKQQEFPFTIDNVWKIHKGEYIVLSCFDMNLVLKHESNSGIFVQSFYLPKQQLFGVSQEYIVTVSGIYGINYISQKVKKIIQEKNIMNSLFVQAKYIAYQTEQQQIKIFCIESQKIIRVYQSLGDIYFWSQGCIEQQIIYSKWTDLSYVYLSNLTKICISQESSEVNPKENGFLLPETEMISDALVRDSRTNHKSTKQIWFALSSGSIYIYLYPKKTLLQKLDSVWTGHVKLIKTNDFKVLAKIGQNYKLIDEYNEEYRAQGIDIDCNVQCIQYLETVSAYLCTKRKRVCLVRTLENQPTSGVAIRPIDKVKSFSTKFIFHEDSIYIAKSNQLAFYDRKSFVQIRKEHTTIKKIDILIKLQNGILVGGTNDIDHAVLELYSYEYLKVIFTVDVGHKRQLGSAFKITPNTFLVSFDTIIRMYQIVNEDEVKQIFSYNTNMTVFQIDVHLQLQRIVICDPYRYICAYDFSKRTLIPLARQMKANVVNDVSFIGNSIIHSDMAGYLGVFDFNLGKRDDIQKMRLSSAWEMYIGQKVFSLSRNKVSDQLDSVYYGTFSGFIGRVQNISAQEFKVLKKAQFDALKRFEDGKILSYRFWRRRNHYLSDRVIDQVLIRKYLEDDSIKNQSRNKQNYENVKKVYQVLKSKIC